MFLIPLVIPSLKISGLWYIAISRACLLIPRQELCVLYCILQEWVTDIWDLFISLIIPSLKISGLWLNAGSLSLSSVLKMDDTFWKIRSESIFLATLIWKEQIHSCLSNKDRTTWESFSALRSYKHCKSKNQILAKDLKIKYEKTLWNCDLIPTEVLNDVNWQNTVLLSRVKLVFVQVWPNVNGKCNSLAADLSCMNDTSIIEALWDLGPWQYVKYWDGQ